MKNLFLLVALLISLSASSQNTMVWYNFQDGTATDLSGSGNDGTLTGRAGVNCENLNGAQVGHGLSNYLTIPPAILNGLKDFTIELHVAFSYWSTGGGSSQNTIMSASNANCINCFGIAYDQNNLQWKLSFNGELHTFSDANVVTAGNWIIVTREKGMVSFYHGEELLGSFIDNTQLNISSVTIGQQEHCAGGCFECNQTMRGSIDYFKVLDFAARTNDVVSNPLSRLNLYPNPVSDVLHVFSSGKNYSSVIITDYSGKIIYTHSYKEEINVADFAAGLYFLQLKSKDNMVSERMGFVKQ